jgi:hypothetical protein
MWKVYIPHPLYGELHDRGPNPRIEDKAVRLESQTEQPLNSGYLRYFPLDHDALLGEAR